jgi:hypothetical protein
MTSVGPAPTPPDFDNLIFNVNVKGNTNINKWYKKPVHILLTLIKIVHTITKMNNNKTWTVQ